MKKYYYVTTENKAGYVSRREIPHNACIVTDGVCMISAPSDSWTAPAYIHAIQPDARIGRTVADCVATIKELIAKQEAA